MTALLETPSPVVGTSWREWHVRARGDLVQVFIHDASKVADHDPDPDDPGCWVNVSLRAEQARELALELQNAAEQITEEVLEEWGLD